ncbi:MAG: formate dehydrogenase accessory sulfurtransferase FdhD [Bacteroidetes bacterium]|nr:formate dehydrogenase accessory sulfurtransferase FdhD [Bacteroidota bacterium]
MDLLAVEEPLEIRLSWVNSAGITEEQSVSITMRTPGQDLELALGFLISEGLLSAPEQLANAEHDDAFCASGQSQNTVRVNLQPGQTPDLERLRRHFYTTSSCGVCGKASLDAVRITLSAAPLSQGPHLSPDQISTLPNLLWQAQGTFQDTGGLHAAGLFRLKSQEPELRVLREDVGRHNAVDKVVGWAFSKGLLPLHNHVLMLSGRASFELIQKAIAAGIPMVAAVGAPSTLAVDLAVSHGLTLLGFVRDGRFNVYSGGGRIEAS